MGFSCSFYFYHTPLRKIFFPYEASPKPFFEIILIQPQHAPFYVDILHIETNIFHYFSSWLNKLRMKNIVSLVLHSTPCRVDYDPVNVASEKNEKSILF